MTHNATGNPGADRRRADIQEAAMLVFSEKGYGKATMPEIARQAGVAVGTIYLHFKTKQEILLSILESHAIIEPLLHFFDRREDVGDRELLAALFEACFRFGHDNINGFLFLLSEILRDPDIKGMYAEKSLRPTLGMLEEYLRSRVESGAFREDLDVKTASQALVGTVMGLILLYGIEYEQGGMDEQWGRVSGAIAGLALEGLKSGVGGGPGKTSPPVMGEGGTE